VSDDPVFDELAARPELFCKQLGGPMRTWFARRILAYVRANPQTHNDHDDAIAALALAKTLAANCDAALAAEPDPQVRLFLLRDLAVRTAYGAMGVHPDALLREDRADYLLFTVKRRCFAVDRMNNDVNQGDEFVYPDGSPLTSHPNLQAQPFWVGVNDNAKHYPFVLSEPTGTGNPFDAVEHMFEANDVQVNRNAFDCAGAAMVVHMAAAVEAAADPSTLSTALAAGGPRYFTIDHPLGSCAVVSGVLVGGVSPMLIKDADAGDHVELTVAFAWWTPPVGQPAMIVAPDHDEQVQIEAVGMVGSRYTGKVTVNHLGGALRAGTRIVPTDRPEFHLITDQGTDSLFEQVFISDDDLQIGDHVYVASHPMHRALLSQVSPWGGEHAFVCSPPIGWRDRTLITGHGVEEQTLRAAIDQHLLVDLNATLDIWRAAVRLQLTTPSPPTWAGSPDQLANAQEFEAGLRVKYGEPDTSAVAGTCRVYDYTGVEFVRDNDPTPRRSSQFQIMTFEGTVGAATVDANVFMLYRGVDPGTVATDWSALYWVLERSDTVNAGRPDLERFGISYRDDTQGYELVFLPFFYTDADQRSGPRRLTYDDVTQTLYGGPDGTTFVTRPRVVADNTGAYLAALRQKGALPPP
jgi:hypothetical protein